MMKRGPEIDNDRYVFCEKNKEIIRGKRNWNFQFY
jgi:hypothetical protein